MSDPLPLELPALLTSALLSIEGLRRDPAPTEVDWTEAEEALDVFDARQVNRVERDIAEEVQTAVDSARRALSDRDLETARRSLIGVGQIFDRWLHRDR